MTDMELACMGPYVSPVPEGLARAKELSRAELRKLVAELEERDRLDSTSSGDVSGPAAQSAHR